MEEIFIRVAAERHFNKQLDILSKWKQTLAVEGLTGMRDEEHWPEKPILKSSSEGEQERKPISEVVSYAAARLQDEFDKLSLRKTYWSTIRITAWILRFAYNLQVSVKEKRRSSNHS